MSIRKRAQKRSHPRARAQAKLTQYQENVVNLANAADEVGEPARAQCTHARTHARTARTARERARTHTAPPTRSESARGLSAELHG